MRGRTPGLILVVVAVIAAAVAFVLAQHGPPAIAWKAAGSWVEVGGPHPQHMTIVRTGVEQYAVHYTAADVGSYADPATLEDDHLQVWGENVMSAPLYQIHYDEARDRPIVDRDDQMARLRRAQ